MAGVVLGAQGGGGACCGGPWPLYWGGCGVPPRGCDRSLLLMGRLAEQWEKPAEVLGREPSALGSSSSLLNKLTLLPASLPAPYPPQRPVPAAIPSRDDVECLPPSGTVFGCGPASACTDQYAPRVLLFSCHLRIFREEWRRPNQKYFHIWET